MAKEFMWQGKKKEELKDLDLKEFMTYIPSRQRRSLKRGFSDQQKKLIKKIENGEKNIKTHCRNMVIIPIMLEQTIRIHNGKDFVPIMITEEMLGHYLGEFALTRRSVSHSSAGVGATRSSKAVSAR